jgi:hypothetical protein
MDEKRYCVTCSVILTGENAHGLICLECFNEDRQAYLDQKHPKLIEVKFCAVCGKSYEPIGNAISHSLCL